MNKLQKFVDLLKEKNTESTNTVHTTAFPLDVSDESKTFTARKSGVDESKGLVSSSSLFVFRMC